KYCILIYLRAFLFLILFFFSSRRRHTRSKRDWSSDVCSSDLNCFPVSHFNLSNKPISFSNSSSDAKGIVILPFPFSLHTNWTFVLKKLDRWSFSKLNSSGSFGFRRSEERRVGKECRKKSRVG